MSIWIRKHRYVAVGVMLGGVFAIFFLASLFFPSTYLLCVFSKDAGYTECGEHHLGPYLVAWLIELLNEHDGVVTGVATVFVALYTWRLWKSADAQGVLTERTIDLSEKQFLMEGAQADLALKQHGLMREQFYAANQPNLGIRAISLTFPHGQPLFDPRRPLAGSIVIVNRGNTEARITSGVYRIMAIRELPMVPPLDTVHVGQLFPEYPHKMDGHESFVTDLASGPLGAVVRAGIIPGPNRLFVMGAIIFEDGLGRERYMGFCWEYHPSQFSGDPGRFVPIVNPAYEYSD